MKFIDGKIAVVTGGTKGLCAAIARNFAMAVAAGMAIVGLGAEKGRKVAEAIEAKTAVPVLVVAADLGNIDDVRQTMAEADARFGRVDILVNAADLTDRSPNRNTTPKLFDRKFAVNTRALLFLMQDAVKIMEREGIEGRIVNIGSASELVGQPFIGLYSASKAVLAALTRNSGYALMSNHIYVN
jgi:NAD(P)-dependent dehydrogenase (short-subunit alcohol dehydrogenase family)